MSLNEIRAEIDRIDIELVGLLVRRGKLAAQAKQFKRPDSVSITACERVAVVLNKVRDQARDEGGDGEMIKRIYEVIIREFTDMQLADLKKDAL